MNGRTPDWSERLVADPGVDCAGIPSVRATDIANRSASEGSALAVQGDAARVGLGCGTRAPGADAECEARNSSSRRDDSRQGSRGSAAAVCGLLCLAAMLVFCQTGAYDFINYDDDHYVYDNEHLNHGFSWAGIVYYAFHWHGYTYHPLTSYSHMLDCQLFGLKAGWHHAVNVALHAATAVLLFLLVRRMTGRLWPSALMAALFAVHPLHVQSVAWIAERKDVLSGLFFMLTIGAYVRYTCEPSLRRDGSMAPVRIGGVGGYYVRRVCAGLARDRYWAVCALYALGLLAKPMLVTLPLVLLLLDYWPLQRRQPLGRLLKEKVPLLLLSAVACALTLHTQVAAIRSLEDISWPARLANVLMAYASYLGCSFWPQGLAVLYPYPSNGYGAAAIVAAATGLVTITVGAVFCRRRAPYVLVGWLWYLGMLVPVIGLVQVGGQSMADRYMYLPQIGLALALVWTLTELADFLAGRSRGQGRACEVPAMDRQDAAPYRNREGLFCLVPGRCFRAGIMRRAQALFGRIQRMDAGAIAVSEEGPGTPSSSRAYAVILPGILAFFAAGSIAALSVVAWRQAGYWRDSETIWDRDMIYANTVAYYNRGLALAQKDRHQEAVGNYLAALAIDPNDPDTHNNLGLSYEALGRLDDAAGEFRWVLAENHKAVAADIQLAEQLEQQGKRRQAERQRRSAAEKKSESIEPQKNLDRVVRRAKASHE